MVSPLQFIHGSVAHSIVVGQILSGNTFEIEYVEDRFGSHDGSSQRSGLLFEGYT